MYVYGFCETSPHPSALARGIAGPLQWVEKAGLGAVVEPDLTLDSLPTEAEELLRALCDHDQILQTLFQQIPILPLRFGTCFGSLEALEEYLLQHGHRYKQQLDLLGHRGEYLLEWHSPPEKPSSELPRQGREYFLAKKDRYQQQITRAERQANQLSWLAQTLMAEYPTCPRATTGLYLLATPAQTGHLLKQLDHWQAHCPDWLLTLGPVMPPYHFLA